MGNASYERDFTTFNPLHRYDRIYLEMLLLSECSICSLLSDSVHPAHPSCFCGLFKIMQRRSNRALLKDAYSDFSVAASSVTDMLHLSPNCF